MSSACYNPFPVTYQHGALNQLTSGMTFKASGSGTIVLRRARSLPCATLRQVCMYPIWASRGIEGICTVHVPKHGYDNHYGLNHITVFPVYCGYCLSTWVRSVPDKLAWFATSRAPSYQHEHYHAEREEVYSASVVLIYIYIYIYTCIMCIYLSPSLSLSIYIYIYIYICICTIVYIYIYICTYTYIQLPCLTHTTQTVSPRLQHLVWQSDQHDAVGNKVWDLRLALHVWSFLLSDVEHWQVTRSMN